MNLARRVTDLISQNVRYSYGDPVECAIAEACIGGASEAVACESLFRRENVGVSLTVTGVLKRSRRRAMAMSLMALRVTGCCT